MKTPIITIGELECGVIAAARLYRIFKRLQKGSLFQSISEQEFLKSGALERAERTVDKMEKRKNEYIQNERKLREKKEKLKIECRKLLNSYKKGINAGVCIGEAADLIEGLSYKKREFEDIKGKWKMSKKLLVKMQERGAI